MGGNCSLPRTSAKLSEKEKRFHEARETRSPFSAHPPPGAIRSDGTVAGKTLRDILDRAGIGSSTFYTHYFDKEDVQTALIEQMLEQLSEPISQNSAKPGLLPSLALFRHIQEHSQHFQALVRGHAEEKVWKVVQTTLSRTIEQTLANTYTEKCSPSDEIFQRLALPGVWTTIEGRSE